MAPWYPFIIALKRAIKATIVLPLPTSPWTNLFIGLGFFWSLNISLTVLVCASVNWKGNLSFKAFRSFDMEKEIPLELILLFFKAISFKEYVNNSWNFNLFLASSNNFKLLGLCIFLIALSKDIKSCSSKIDFGKFSFIFTVFKVSVTILFKKVLEISSLKGYLAIISVLSVVVFLIMVPFLIIKSLPCFSIMPLITYLLPILKLLFT